MNAEEILDLLPFGESAIVAMAALSAALAALFVWRALLFRDPLGSRLAGLETRHAALRQGMLAPTRRVRHAQSLNAMRRLVAAMNLLRSREATKAALHLARAGLRSKDALVVFFFLKLALPFLFGALAIVWLYTLEMVNLEPMPRLMAALGLVLIGAWTPDLYVRNAASKRSAAMRKGVPDALDLLVICAEAGQSLDGALKRVAGEIGLFSPPLAEELSLTAIELGLMPDRRVALENLVKRTDLAEIKSVVNALAQTEKYGTPLAQSLRVLAAEYRSNRLMRAEEKAARLPAILTVPMITFILPPLFVVLLGPAVLRVIDQFIRL
jgi:tight adherence protein C